MLYCLKDQGVRPAILRPKYWCMCVPWYIAFKWSSLYSVEIPEHRFEMKLCHYELKVPLNSVFKILCMNSFEHPAEIIHFISFCRPFSLFVRYMIDWCWGEASSEARNPSDDVIVKSLFQLPPLSKARWTITSKVVASGLWNVLLGPQKLPLNAMLWWRPYTLPEKVQRVFARRKNFAGSGSVAFIWSLILHLFRKKKIKPVLFMAGDYYMAIRINGGHYF